MADTKISAETTITPLDGTELVVLSDGGANGKTTTQDIADLAAGGVIGSDTQVAFNDAGTMSGDADFTYDKTSGYLKVQRIGDVTANPFYLLLNSGTFQLTREASINGALQINFPVKTPGFWATPTAFASIVNPGEGMIAAITDSSTATWGATITGGGSNHVLGYYNGTNWTVMAK